MKKQLKDFFKWSGKYQKMLRLATIRGKGWASKHRDVFFRLKAKVDRFQKAQKSVPTFKVLST